jgi:hypothetical protein
MATQAEIDRNNAEYANAQNAANYWLSQGNMQAAHDAHKVMQAAAEANQRMAPQVAAANAAWHLANAPTSTSSSPPAPSPTPPNPWITNSTFVMPKGIKQADPDIIIEPGTDTSGDYIVERFFEELGGTELINLSRYDLIDGIDVTYNPIANLSRLRKRFNPNNIIALDILSEDEFSKFSIDLLSRGIYEPYFDDDGNLVVEVDIIRSEENIDVEISLSGTLTRVEL